MLIAKYQKVTLNFKKPSGTSRGILHSKNSWIISIHDSNAPIIVGKGEASIIESLSPDWHKNYEDKIEEVCESINLFTENLNLLENYPSICFALETALKDLKNGGKRIIYTDILPDSKIKINGLIWMGDKSSMLKQIEEKINAGFDCIKLKIGAIDFNSEIELIRHIRQTYSKEEIEIRVDANGAFSPTDAMNKLHSLSRLDIHSIEQPIKQGQLEEMASLCKKNPIPIALDEELIGIIGKENKLALLKKINPQFIILKPSLIGGIAGTEEWINLADSLNIKWWITSALEGNIGLNAIAQFTYTKQNPLPQGLGTGGLFINNTAPFLKVENGFLSLNIYNQESGLATI